MSALKAYFHAVRGLRPDQLERLPAVEWLLDTTESVRRQGRTTLMAAAFIRDACANPGRWIRVFDHFPQDRTSLNIAVDSVMATVAGSGAGDLFESNRSEIRVKEGKANLELDLSGAMQNYVRRCTGRSTAVPIGGRRTLRDLLLDELRDAVRASIAAGVGPDAISAVIGEEVTRAVMEE